MIAEQQRRRRRPRPRLRRPPRARLRPLFLSLRGCFRRHGPRSSACHRQRGALRHAHHPHGMPFTKSRRRVRQELRVVPPREQDGTPRVSTSTPAARRRWRRGHRQRAHVVRVRSFRPREGPSVQSPFVWRDTFKRRDLRVDARGEDDIPVGRRGEREDVRAVLPVRAELRAVLRVPEGDVAVAAAADEGTVGEVLERPHASFLGLRRFVPGADGDAGELGERVAVEDVDGASAGTGGNGRAVCGPGEGEESSGDAVEAAAVGEAGADAVAGDEGEQSDASVVAGDGYALGGAAARGGLGGHGPDGAAVGVGGAAGAEGVEVPLRDLAVEAGGEEAARRGLRAAAASPVSVVREREGRAPRQGRHRGALATGHACRASPVGGVVNLEVACLARERDGQAPWSHGQRHHRRGLPLHKSRPVQFEHHRAGRAAVAGRGRRGSPPVSIRVLSADVRKDRERRSRVAASRSRLSGPRARAE